MLVRYGVLVIYLGGVNITLLKFKEPRHAFFDINRKWGRQTLQCPQFPSITLYFFEIQRIWVMKLTNSNSFFSLSLFSFDHLFFFSTRVNQLIKGGRIDVFTLQTRHVTCTWFFQSVFLIVHTILDQNETRNVLCDFMSAFWYLWTKVE